jgi:hypothetical protein
MPFDWLETVLANAESKGITGDGLYLQESSFTELPCRKPYSLRASDVITRCDENRGNLLVHYDALSGIHETTRVCR